MSKRWNSLDIFVLRERERDDVADKKKKKNEKKPKQNTHHPKPTQTKKPQYFYSCTEQT